MWKKSKKWDYSKGRVHCEIRKNLSFGKQRESLIMAYWEDQEDKRLKTEALIPQTLSLA